MRSVRDGMLKTQKSTAVGTSSVQIAPPNDRRWSVIISPSGALSAAGIPQTVEIDNVSTATTGVKLSYTVPAGRQATLTSAVAFSTAVGGQAMALQLVRGADTITMTQGTTAQTFTGNVQLSAGDTIQWNVTGAVGASTADMYISVIESSPSARVTISLGDTAVLDNGLTIYPGSDPLYLTWSDMGAAIREQINAIASGGTITVTVLDVFCECGLPPGPGDY